MKEKNKIGSLATALGVSFVISLALTMVSNATENPFNAASMSSGYIVADGHKHTDTEQDTDTDTDTDTEQDTDTDTEQDQNKQKKSKCNPDKGQNCNEPSW